MVNTVNGEGVAGDDAGSPGRRAVQPSSAAPLM